MSGLLGGGLTPQQQMMLSLMAGQAPGGWSPAQQNATPGTFNALSGLPTAAGVAVGAPGAGPLAGQPGQAPLGPLAAAQQAALTQQQNVYGGGHPISERNAGLLGAAGFPSYQDPRLVADSLAVAAQQPGLDPDELQRRQDAFQRYMARSGGGGGGEGREGEGGAGGGGEHASGGGQGQDASGQW